MDIMEDEQCSMYVSLCSIIDLFSIISVFKALDSQTTNASKKKEELQR